MCGSSPLAEAVTRSTGMSAVLPGSAARSAAMRDWAASVKAELSGPSFEPDEAAALYGNGDVAESRPQKYFGVSNGWPMRAEPTGPTGGPLRTIRLPLACTGNI